MILIIKHIAIEGPGTIGEFFAHRNQRVNVIDLGRGSKLPEDISEIEAVIVLGGPMNVYEETKYPFLKKEDIFIKKIIKAEVPLLGICLGAQLIAKAAGAQVRMEKYREMGWHSIILTEEGKKCPLFAGIAGELKAFQWHEDSFDLPKGSTLLAKSSICAQGFRLGENSYGLQFHFEVTSSMIQDWISEYSKDDKIRNMPNHKEMSTYSDREKDTLCKQAYVILSGFYNLIQQKSIVAS